MKHLINLTVSFIAAWTVSIIALVFIGWISESGRQAYHAHPVQDFLHSLCLFSFFSFVCVGVAWLLLAAPYYLLFMRNEPKKRFWLHATSACLLGSGFMVFVTEFLPIDHESWKTTAPVAALAGFAGVITLK